MNWLSVYRTSIDVRDVRRRVAPPLTLLFALAMVTMSGVHAESAGDAALEEIVVTGTLLRGTPVDGAFPVNQVTEQDIQLGAFDNVYEALVNQPVFTGSADNDTRAGAFGQNVVNLRGIGSDFTLLLLNGRRLAVNDLNLLPFAAVERIEVLKDGSSATYGSDALAGVVNVITRDRFEGTEFRFYYRVPDDFSDGDSWNASFIGGVQGDRGGVVLTAQLEDVGSVLSLEHPLGMTDNLDAIGGEGDRRRARRNPGLITLADGTQLMLDPDFAPGQTGGSVDDFTAPFSQLIEKQQVNNVQNSRRESTVYATGHFMLVDEVLEVFGDVLVKESDVGFVDHRGTFLNFEVPAENYWNPFGEPVNVSYLLDYGTEPDRFERGLETFESDITTTRYTFGIRGDLTSRIDYEIAYLDYENVNDQSQDGLSRRGILDQLARTDPGALNLFGNAAITPEQLEPAREEFTRTFTRDLQMVSGLLRFDLVDLPAGPIRTAVGAERREEGFALVPEVALARFADSAAVPFINDPPRVLGRTVEAYYAEVNVPIFSPANAVDGFEEFDVGFAVRREDISEFGSSTAPQMNVRWVPLESGSLILRASYSESFRAPNLVNLTAPGDRNTSFFADPLILDEDGDPLVYLMETESGGNPRLDATDGKYINIGAIFRPTALPGLSVSVDYFELEQTNAFVRPTVENVLLGIAPGQIVREAMPRPGDNFTGDPVGRISLVVNRIANAASRDVAGVDVDLAYSFDTEPLGSWSLRWANTFMTRFDFDQADGAGTQDNLGKFSAFGAIPDYRGMFQVTNEFRSLTTRLNVSYQPSVSDLRNDGEDINDFVKADLTFTYDLGSGGSRMGEGLAVTLAVENVFDEDAPFSQFFPTGIQSDRSLTHLWLGRTVKAGFRKSF